MWLGNESQTNFHVAANSWDRPERAQKGLSWSVIGSTTEVRGPRFAPGLTTVMR
jgi:hypothetical protein